MTQTRPIITKTKLDALTAWAFAWLIRLMGLLLVFGEPRRLKRLVRRWERRVERIVYLAARLRIRWGRRRPLNLEPHVARLLSRLLRGLRRAGYVLVAPPAQALCAAPAHATAIADTS